MTALSVQVPFPVFYDRDGQPLDSGEIYIGIANLDPLTNPLQVYYDQALTIPASQPLITTAGYIYRNGTPAQIFVDASNFSILVNDQNGLLVYSFPEATGLGTGASSITYNEGSTGAVTRTVEARLRDYPSVMDFGAVGNGIANDAAAFVLANNAGPFTIPAGTYRIATNLALTNPVSIEAGAKIAVQTGVTFTFSGVQDTVSVSSFGAVGNGTTNDSAAFQAAINSGAPVFVPYTASGFALEDTITLPAGSSITGDSFSNIISRVDTSEFVFEITGDDVDISGLRIDCSNVVGGTGAIRIRTDIQSIQRINIKNIFTYRCNFGLRDVNHASNIIVALSVSDFRMNQHQGPGFYFQRAFAYIEFSYCTVDYVNSPVIPNFVAYTLIGNRGSSWDHVDTTGGTVTSATLGNTGFFFYDSWAVWMNSCMADTVGGYGFDFSALNYYVIMQGCVASLCGRHGFAVTGGNEFQFSACSSRGRADQATPLANQNAYHLISSDRIVITGCKALLATGSGYYADTVTRSNVTGSRSDICTGWGVDSANTNGILFASMGFDVCAAGNADFSSAGMFLTSSVSNSGALINLTGPGTI
jgi:hypothetical protein